jgi:hypothetical protein
MRGFEAPAGMPAGFSRVICITEIELKVFRTAARSDGRSPLQAI